MAHIRPFRFILQRNGSFIHIHGTSRTADRWWDKRTISEPEGAMLKFSFRTTKAVLVEAGSSARIGDFAAELGARSVLIVTDRGIEAAGLLDPAIASLKARNIGVELFTDVLADPPEDVVMKAVQIAQERGAECVIGLGGGSSMDVAKLVALLAKGREKLDDIYGVGFAKGPRLPLILVPTTAGTGSEVTQISIVTTRSGEKKGVVAPVLLPDYAILDADLTLKCPPHVTAATGVDAMVHAIEAYTSKHAKNPISDALARDALRLLSGNVRIACTNGSDRSARQNMLLGAMLAGMAFANAPVAAVHALAYPIGARFHVAHGLSNALVLPHVLRFNTPAAVSHYAELSTILVPKAAGSDEARAVALVDALRGLTAELGLETRLAQVGIAQKDLSALAEDAMKQTRLLVNNPREMTYDHALAIYQEAL
jgi:alcohol dehydrogenase class IV